MRAVNAVGSVVVAAGALLATTTLVGCVARPTHEAPPANGDYMVVTSDLLNDHASLISISKEGPIEQRRLKGVGLTVSLPGADEWLVAGERSVDLVRIDRHGAVNQSQVAGRGVGLTDMAKDGGTGLVRGIVNGDSGSPGKPMPLVDVHTGKQLMRLPAGHFTRILDAGQHVIFTGNNIEDENWSGRIAVVDKESGRARTLDPTVDGGLEGCALSRPTEVTCIEAGLVADGSPMNHAVVVSTVDGKVLARARVAQSSTSVISHGTQVWTVGPHGLSSFDGRLTPGPTALTPRGQDVDSVTVVSDTAHVVTRHDHRRPLDGKRVDMGSITTVDLDSGKVTGTMPLILPDDDNIATIRVMPSSWFAAPTQKP